MVLLGNLFTRYNYRRYRVHMQREADRLHVRVQNVRTGQLQLDAAAHLKHPVLPAGSPFTSEHEARRFAGPLPWTFDLDRDRRSLIAVKGVREHWQPQLVCAEVVCNRFLEQPPFAHADPVLASAFHVSGIDYHWRRGVREPIGDPACNDPSAKALSSC